MAVKYGKKSYKQNNVIYTVIVAFLLCVVVLSTLGHFYITAEDEAYEALHIQTKQIKDDIILQLTSDRENLLTMANFAAKLYSDGDDYSLLFDSFSAIGMIENIGILNRDNTFVTKNGVTDLNGILSFEEEKEKGIYISGRIADVTKKDYELIRSAVPIKADGEVVGILYGAVAPEKFGKRYKDMVDDLDAQLFVYEKSSGDILIDTIQDDLGNISFLKDRVYNEGSSYEQLISTDKGFVSFASAYRNENLHLHYSEIDNFGWMIALGRYDSQVFMKTHNIAKLLLFVFLIMLVVIGAYIIILMMNERKDNAVIECASNVRKELLETVNGQNNIQDALVEVCRFAKARSAIFFDSDGAFYHYVEPQYEEIMLSEKERMDFRAELFRYASEFRTHKSDAVNVLCIKPNKHLLKTNAKFYKFLKEHGIREVSFSSTTDNINHTTILASINSVRGNQVRRLAEKVSACFSMALYNKNHLNETALAATTDALTGVLNRVAYKYDLVKFEDEKKADISCVYIDVNELHIMNNKHGHNAGDEMLLYISNTLKDVFYGHKVYRIGGDEFLVLCVDTSHETIEKCLGIFEEQLKSRNYHVATGVSHRSQNADIEKMVREAEQRMYEEKIEYYQSKKKASVMSYDNEFVQMKTGILEIDAILSILKENYNGIYRVSLSEDNARRILMPAYLGYKETEENFSTLFSKYIEEMVDPDYHRAITTFLNYEALKNMLEEGKIPKVTYKKINGDHSSLSIYKLGGNGEKLSDTLWVFAKE